MSGEFVHAYLITMRPYLLFVSGITGIVGMALAPPIPLGPSLLLGAVFFLSYGFGQALTDCFQLDTDSLSAPYRPLVQGRVGRRDVMLVSVLGLSVSGLVVVSYNLLNLPLAALAVLGLATYTPFKRIWWSGPFYNAWIVALLCLIGYAAATGAGNGALGWSGALGGVLVAVFFGYANFVLTGYYKDISADRTTGYRTLPVAFGTKRSAVASSLFALAEISGCVWAAVAAVSAGTNILQLGAIPFAVAGTYSAVLAQLRLRRVSERDAHKAIAPVVQAYLLLLSAIAVLARPTWLPVLVLFYAGFLVALKLRPMQSQI
ncbi:MAG: UbiA family prenyltransferase [Gemmatimonadales bacterium]